MLHIFVEITAISLSKVNKVKLFVNKRKNRKKIIIKMTENTASTLKKTYKQNDPKYFCNFCKKHANENLAVYSIQRTIIYWALRTRYFINGCDTCIKKIVWKVVSGKVSNMEGLKEQIFERIPEISEEFIKNTATTKILNKLYDIRHIDLLENEQPEAKRRKIFESSHESGNTTTLAPVRGTMVGGGLPGFKAPGGASSQQSNYDSQESPSQRLPQRGKPIAKQHMSDSQTPKRNPRVQQGYDTESSGSSSSEEDDEDDQPEPVAESNPLPLEGSIAPRQVPRMRQPQLDGFRLAGA